MSEHDLSVWREARGRHWYRDVGYVLETILRRHRYEYGRKGDKPDDPGWHECSCGWAGYWVEFHSHVADHLRAAAVDPVRYRAEYLDVQQVCKNSSADPDLNGVSDGTWDPALT